MPRPAQNSVVLLEVSISLLHCLLFSNFSWVINMSVWNSRFLTTDWWSVLYHSGNTYFDGQVRLVVLLKYEGKYCLNSSSSSLVHLFLEPWTRRKQSNQCPNILMRILYKGYQWRNNIRLRNAYHAPGKNHQRSQVQNCMVTKHTPKDKSFKENNDKIMSVQSNIFHRVLTKM